MDDSPPARGGYFHTAFMTLTQCMQVPAEIKKIRLFPESPGRLEPQRGRDIMTLVPPSPRHIVATKDMLQETSP